MKTLITTARYFRSHPVVLATAVSALCGLSPVYAGPGTRPAGTSDDLTTGARGIHSAHDLSTAFERVATAVEPSVVSIRSVSRLDTGNGLQQAPFSFHGSPFEDFFRDPFRNPRNDRLQPQQPPRGFAQQGQGTGFILSEDGYVVTNHHVVDGADEVTVTLWDESSYVATLVGTDPKTDIAVLRIEAEGLKPATLADPDSVRVGSWVAAMGSPFGLASTMTSGIVSAVGRSRVGLTDYENFIQTDAAINPGNSGGPLVNLDGEVVGINTAIFSRSGGYMGIGFAIPIDLARSVIDGLVEHGHVQRGLLGVIIQNLDKPLARSFGHDGTKGALVSDLSEGGPADRAGMRPGDIILQVDDHEIEDVDALRFLIARTRPGTLVAVEFVRDGKLSVVEVEVAELEPAGDRPAAKADTSSLGMSLDSLSGRTAERLGLETDQQGVLVTGVEPLGAASRAGIRLNDVILSVDGEAVENVEDFRRGVANAQDEEGVLLTVLTGKTRHFVFLKLDR